MPPVASGGMRHGYLGMVKANYFENETGRVVELESFGFHWITKSADRFGGMTSRTWKETVYNGWALWKKA